MHSLLSKPIFRWGAVPILILVVLCTLVDNGDLFQYPFQAKVWGTVSDWAMVIVTGFTAYYLVKSFKAQVDNNNIQTKTLLEQQKLTIIEQYIHRERVKPSFSLRPFPKEKIIEHNIAKFSYSFHFIVQNGTAKNIVIKAFLFNHESGVNQELFTSTDDEKYPGDNIGFMETAYEQKKLEEQIDNADYVFRFEFFIEYDDILDNHYKTSAMFFEDSNGLTNLHHRGIKLIEKK